MKKLIYIIILSLFAPLVSAKEKGNIQILCEAKVKVFLNNVYVGKSREKLNGYIIKNLDYGTYNIELEYQDMKEEFTVDLQDTIATYISKEFTHQDDKINTLNPKDKEDIPDPTPLIYDTTGDFVPVDIFPELTYREEVKYPNHLKDAGINGTVTIKSFVNENGEVTESQIAKSSGNRELDQLALTASYKNKFLPAIYENKPIATWCSYNTVFGDSEQKSNPVSSEDYPAEDEFVPVEVMPEMIKMNPPEYPKESKEKNHTGIVWVKCLVDKNGNVVKSKVMKPSGREKLDKAAVEASYKNKFTPGIQNGKPVAVWVTYKVNFSLDN